MCLHILKSPPLCVEPRPHSKRQAEHVLHVAKREIEDARNSQRPEPLSHDLTPRTPSDSFVDPLVAPRHFAHDDPRGPSQRPGVEQVGQKPQMWLDMKPKASRQLPGPAGMTAAGVGIGVVSSLVGAGGGVISIPLMTSCNVPMRNAIGTSAALGLPIAIAGAAGYLITGLDQNQLPPLTFGYLYLPALIGIVLGTFFTVPYGARAAHSMPVPMLKKIFGVILFLLATKMLLTLF